MMIDIKVTPIDPLGSIIPTENEKQTIKMGLFGGGCNTQNLKTIKKTASVQAINGHRVVIAVGSDGVDYADANNLSHFGLVIGLTKNAASINGISTIINDDEIEHSGWSFIPNMPVYLGTNGNLTQTIPTIANSKFLQQIGTAISSNKLNLTIYQPILLGN